MLAAPAWLWTMIIKYLYICKTRGRNRHYYARETCGYPPTQLILSAEVKKEKKKKKSCHSKSYEANIFQQSKKINKDTNK
jgi:hypothetical protein